MKSKYHKRHVSLRKKKKNSEEGRRVQRRQHITIEGGENRASRVQKKMKMKKINRIYK